MLNTCVFDAFLTQCRYFFDPDFPEDNNIPTINTNLTEGAPRLLSYAPTISADFFFPSGQGRKFMSCCHCQELCQQVNWHLIGCIRVSNQSEARLAS